MITFKFDYTKTHEIHTFTEAGLPGMSLVLANILRTETLNVNIKGGMFVYRGDEYVGKLYRVFD